MQASGLPSPQRVIKLPAANSLRRLMFPPSRAVVAARAHSSPAEDCFMVGWSQHGDHIDVLLCEATTDIVVPDIESLVIDSYRIATLSQPIDPMARH